MPRIPEDDVSLTGPLLSGRPQEEHAIARRIGLNRILRTVLGQAQSDTSIAGFTLEEKLGEGGMGVVYRARSASGKRVAIKVVEQGNEKAQQRFSQEVALLGRLSHPRIVRYLDHGVSAEGFQYLVMEWLEGCDLASRLRRGPLALEDAVRVATEGALGLGAAHAAGVLHRDVKPGNLFLVGDDVENLRVIDFGIALVERGTTRLTSTGAVLGTPSYMAPEQVRGAESVRTDVYALGATLFECLTGRPVFVGEHPGAILLSVMVDPAPSVRTLRPEVPRALDALVGRMLAKSPEQRPIDMGAVLLELSELSSMLVGRESAPVISLSERVRAAPTHSSYSAPWTSGAPVFFGRARELSRLCGELSASREELTPGLVVLTGDAGIGKSALLHAFEMALEATSDTPTVVKVRGRTGDAGTPFALLRALLSSLRDTDIALAVELQEVERCLAELDAAASCRVAHELSALGDRLRIAWAALAEALLADREVVLLVDDVHHADASSLRLLRRAFSLPTSAARLFVFAARPESTVSEIRGTFGVAQEAEWKLGSLGKRATELLAREWARTALPSFRERAVQLSGGHPERLRTLLTFDHAGETWVDLPDRSPLAELDAESRRVLRAVAIIGAPCQRNLLARLLGLDAWSSPLEERLSRLVRAQALRVDADNNTYELTDELLRREALALCTEEDLKSAHREVAHFMLEHQPLSTAKIAGHFAAAMDNERAAEHYLRAARAAFAGEDVELAARLVEQAIACDPSDELAAALEAVRAETALWSGQLEQALRASTGAAARERPGSMGYFVAQSLAVTAAGQLGENERVRQIVREVSTRSVDEAARDAHITCFARGLTQLLAMSEAEGLHFVDQLEQSVVATPVSTGAMAWVERVRGWLVLEGPIDEIIRVWMRCHGAFERAGDPRTAAQVQINLASLHVWFGAWEAAAQVLDRAALVAHRLDSPYLARWTRFTRGKLFAETRDFAFVNEYLSAIVDELRESPRMRAGAELYRGLAALRHGALDSVKRAADEARRAHTSQVVQVPALALQVLSCARSRRGEALEPLLDEFMGARASVTRLPEFVTLVDLAEVEGLFACDRREAAQASLGRAIGRLEQRARGLADPVARSHFLTRPHAHASLWRLVDVHAARGDLARERTDA